jgi:hypothetical protein
MSDPNAGKRAAAAIHKALSPDETAPAPGPTDAAIQQALQPA